MEALIGELRYTLRELRKRPTFTATAIVSLALGIGATTAVFSVIYAVLINPFPYRGAERIFEIHILDMNSADLDRSTNYSGADAAQLRQLKSF